MQIGILPGYRLEQKLFVCGIFPFHSQFEELIRVLYSLTGLLDLWKLSKLKSGETLDLVQIEEGGGVVKKSKSPKFRRVSETEK